VPIAGTEVKEVTSTPNLQRGEQISKPMQLGRFVSIATLFIVEVVMNRRMFVP
jgi:hypothetical protein